VKYLTDRHGVAFGLVTTTATVTTTPTDISFAQALDAIRAATEPEYVPLRERFLPKPEPAPPPPIRKFRDAP
jgi:hypothetical protein